MRKRPISVTVVCWILIVMSTISLLASTMALNNPVTRELMAQSALPVNLQYVLMYAGLLVTLISSAAMLKGHNWARWLYTGWSTLGFLVGIVTSPAKAAMIPGLVIFLIIVYFLFRPPATMFFQPAKAADDT